MARIGIGVLVPVVLILTNVRLLLTPLFVSVEYSTPGFPDDPYGFTREERRRLAEIARAYLLNDAGPEFLADVRDPNGIALFNPRELSHMVDVKVLVQAALAVWLGLLVVLGLLAFAAWRFGGLTAVRRGFQLGRADYVVPDGGPGRIAPVVLLHPLHRVPSGLLPERHLGLLHFGHPHSPVSDAILARRVRAADGPDASGGGVVVVGNPAETRSPGWIASIGAQLTLGACEKTVFHLTPWPPLPR